MKILGALIVLAGLSLPATAEVAYRRASHEG